MAFNAAEQEILDLTHQLLRSIAEADWEAYESLCDTSLTCFEPEARGQLVQGLAFHRFYFQWGAAKKGHETTICSPSIRVSGDLALIAYIRLNQRITAENSPKETAVEETRVWQRIAGKWRHVHFHRSPLG
ncbi:nuclear transport factor 2 family protein [bacterium]|jgi:ketosteroid isomerase-like protein|nr:nuclear transport factor 2 family protein [bacterium]